MIAQSFEITANISKSSYFKSRVFHPAIPMTSSSHDMYFHMRSGNQTKLRPVQFGKT